MAKTYIWSGVKPPWRDYETTQKTKVFNAIKAAGENGIDREAICNETGVIKQRVWFYLSELRRSGLIKRMGDAVDITTLTPDEAKLHALSVLENALVIHARKTGVTDEQRRGFAKYQKIKALALGGLTQGETQAALRAAVLELVKLVF